MPPFEIALLVLLSAAVSSVLTIVALNILEARAMIVVARGESR